MADSHEDDNGATPSSTGHSDALTRLRALVYEDDLEALARFQARNPSLMKDPLAFSYVWTHYGDRLLALLAEGEATPAAMAVLSHFPKLIPQLTTFALDHTRTDRARDSARRLISLIRAPRAAKQGAHMSDDDIDDLFGSDESGDDDFDEIPKRLLLLEPVEGSPRSDVIELSGGELNIHYVEDEYNTQLSVQASVINLSEGAIELGNIVLVARDKEGMPVGVAEVYQGNKFKRAREVIEDAEFPLRALHNTHTIDVCAELNGEFKFLLATAKTQQTAFGLAPGTAIKKSAGATRSRWAFEFEDLGRMPGRPRIDFKAVVFAAYRWEDASCEVVFDYTESGSSSDRYRDLVFALRGADGKVLAKETQSFSAPTTGAISGQTRIEISRNKITEVVQLDVAVKGTREWRAPLGSFLVKKG